MTRCVCVLAVVIWLTVKSVCGQLCNSTVDENNITTPIPGCRTACGNTGNLASYSWVLANDQSSFFTLFSGPSLQYTTWSGARSACSTLFGNGSDLAVPKSHQDVIYMQSLLPTASSSSAMYYIGGFQNISAFSFATGGPVNTEPEGGWQWIDGTYIDMTQNTTKWTFSSSTINYPSDTTSAGCVVLQPGKNGILEATCSAQRGFFCSIKSNTHCCVFLNLICGSNQLPNK
jgi:hypothetical protein